MRYKIMMYWDRIDEWIEYNQANLIHKAIHRFSACVEDYPDISSHLVDTGESRSLYSIMREHDAVH